MPDVEAAMGTPPALEPAPALARLGFEGGFVDEPVVLRLLGRDTEAPVAAATMSLNAVGALLAVVGVTAAEEGCKSAVLGY